MILSNFIRKHFAQIFFFIFALGFQMIIWNNVVITDGRIWERRIQSMSQDLFKGASFDLRQYSGHPGTPILLTGSGLIYLGATSSVALRVGLSLMMVIILMAIVEVLRRYGQNALWPYAAGGVLALHPLLAQSSPTNTISSALLVLVVLMTLRFERKASLSRLYIVALGIALGALVATRFATGGLLSIFVVGYMLYRKRSRSSLSLLILISLLAFFVLDPFLWQAPIEHIQHMVGRADLHLREAALQQLTLRRFILFSPLALLSIALAILQIVFSRRLQTRPSVSWLLFVIFLTATFTTIFLSAQTQSLRYFYPFIFLWEALLPMSLFHFATFVHFPFSPDQQIRSQRILRYFILSLLVGGQLILLVYTLTLPKWIVAQEVFPTLVQ